MKKRWIKQAKDGDVEAFEKILTEHENQIYCLLRNWVDDQQLREVMGEIFLQVYHAFPSYSEKEDFQVWLYRMVVQVCGDPVGNTQKERDEESKPDFLMLFRQIPLLYQKSILLRNCVGLTYKEIAAVYHMDPAAIRLQISEGRKKLCQLAEENFACDNAWADIISSGVDGELTDDKEQKWAEHDGQCEACHGYTDFLIKLSYNLSEDNKIPEDLHENAMEVVMTDIERRTVQYTGPKHHIPVFTLLGAAAAVVILVLSGAFGNIAIFNTPSVSTGTVKNSTDVTSDTKTDNDENSEMMKAALSEDKAQIDYNATDVLLDIPKNIIQGKSYASYSLAVGDGDIPEIEGTLLAAEDNAIYMQILKNSQVLENIYGLLQKNGFTVYQPSDERITISSQSQKALLVIFRPNLENK